MIKKAIHIVLLLASLSILGQNQNLFDQGIKEYREGNYEQAISAWKSILESEQHSAALYFNLGNAFFRLENIPHSIYYYEKALQLSPGDSDIRENLAIAQKHVTDVIEPLPKNIFSTWFSNISSLLTYNSWAILAVVFSLLFTLFFYLFYTKNTTAIKRAFFTFASASVFLALFSVLFAHNNYKKHHKTQVAIIFDNAIQVRNDPVDRGELLFVLHQGTKVQVMDQLEEWVRIRLADGKNGWTLKKHLRNL